MDITAHYERTEYQARHIVGNGDIGVLLLHGFMGTPAEFSPLIDAFIEQGFTVTVPLLPGFGTDIETLPKRRYQEWVRAATTEWLALKEQHRTSILIGHSMGGALATLLAADAPADKLILTAPFWRINAPSWQTMLIPIAKHAIKEYKIYAGVDFSQAGWREHFSRILPDADLDDPAVQHQIRHKMTIPMPALDELRKIGRTAFNAAPRVISPTLLVQGMHDTTVTPANTNLLLQQFTTTTVETYYLPDGTHDLVQSFSPHHPTVISRIQDFITKDLA